VVKAETTAQPLLSLQPKTICGQPDPFEPLKIHVLGVDGRVAEAAVENVSDDRLDAGISWAIRSERNDLHGHVFLGNIPPGGAVSWTADLAVLNANLEEHLGVGELLLWPCIPAPAGRSGCRMQPDEAILYFVASRNDVRIVDGPTPLFASPAGRELAEASGLLALPNEPGAVGEATLTVYVEKISDRVDEVLLADVDEGEGGAP